MKSITLKQLNVHFDKSYVFWFLNIEYRNKYNDDIDNHIRVVNNEIYLIHYLIISRIFVEMIT